MFIWELEELLGLRFCEQGWPQEFRQIVTQERLKRMNIGNIPGFEISLAQWMEQFQATREAEVVAAMAKGESYVPLDRAKSTGIAQFASARNALLMQVIRDYDAQNKQLVTILNDIKAGKVDPQTVSPTDDGVTIMPARPKAQKENGNGIHSTDPAKEPAHVG